MKAALDLLHALLLVLDDEEVSSQLCTVAEKKNSCQSNRQEHGGRVQCQHSDLSDRKEERSDMCCWGKNARSFYFSSRLRVYDCYR